MINLDMVGYLGRGQYFTGFNSGDSSPDIGRIIEDLNKKYSFAKKITSRGSGGSDHASFYNKRVPIAFLHTGLHRYYHTPDDTADKINYDGIEKVARYGFELAWRICQAEGQPIFNVAKFKEMPYVHDHGHPEVPFPHGYHQHGNGKLHKHE
jgi:Zn-dependent M28 family amino/carboxypeptidase